mmetsp:Transcript_5548/g.9100  ORF Transcript_5548/g.9100 Transcript_5548/m.9100 type:complete len:288 (+) Transcript_5548:308-1171(+)
MVAHVEGHDLKVIENVSDAVESVVSVVSGAEETVLRTSSLDTRSGITDEHLVTTDGAVGEISSASFGPLIFTKGLELFVLLLALLEELAIVFGLFLQAGVSSTRNFVGDGAPHGLDTPQTSLTLDHVVLDRVNVSLESLDQLSLVLELVERRGSNFTSLFDKAQRSVHRVVGFSGERVCLLVQIINGAVLKALVVGHLVLGASDLSDLDTELSGTSVLLLGLGVEEREPMLDGVADVDVLVFGKWQSHFSNKVSADRPAVVAVDGDDSAGQSVGDVELESRVPNGVH